MRAIGLLSMFFASGCAFIDPVWEFTTNPTGMDGGERDAGPRPDAGDAGSADAGPVGPGVCRPCTFATDDGCPDGFGCYVDNPGGAECTVCIDRTDVNAGLGDTCVGGPDCEQGLDCINRACRTFCATPDECAGDDSCWMPSFDSLTGWCLTVECDPFATPTSCPVAGEGCNIIFGASTAETRLSSTCLPAGITPAEQQCFEAIECEAGTMCLTTASAMPRCRQICRNDADCSMGVSNRCAVIGTLSGVDMGACLQGCTSDTDCTLGGTCETTQGICF